MLHRSVLNSGVEITGFRLNPWADLLKVRVNRSIFKLALVHVIKSGLELVNLIEQVELKLLILLQFETLFCHLLLQVHYFEHQWVLNLFVLSVNCWFNQKIIWIRTEASRLVLIGL